METYLLDWANLLVRWLHLISGVAWIGASFYFVMLDTSLSKPQRAGDRERGVFGELWAVHGGGVYHSQKYLAGPIGEPLPEKLHWSKWEAYTTWLSGMGMLVIIYWFGAATYLIDPGVMAWSEAQAIAISLFSLIISWLVYDGLCRVLDRRENLLATVLFVYVMFCAWGLFQLLSARAAYIHVGAIMGTLMAANVFFHIIPGQKKMLQEIRAGVQPNPRYGQIGKQRSVHNTYFTLPVLLIMISNHYPMTYSHPQGWVVLGLMMLAGVLIRQFFVLRHVGKALWWLPVTAIALILLTLFWLRPPGIKAGQANALVPYAEVKSILQQRCVACHAQVPTQAGFMQPPKGIVLESDAQIAQQAAMIGQTVSSRYMPIGNLTAMTEAERDRIAIWVAQGASVGDP